MRNPFEFVLALLAICFVYSLLSAWLRQRNKSDKAAESINAELLARLTKAEERIQVLERIVTDERWDLKKEFRDLER